jgi:hypothetical protein
MLGGGAWLYVLAKREVGTLSAIESSLEAALDESLMPASDVEEGSRIGFELPGLAGVQAA